MFVRQMMYLVAVARERHFARAAAACHVSQPTLSAGLRKLEEELGMPLVIRGHRFLGLTPEGERVLSWAKQIIADYESLKQDLSTSDDRLFGTLRLASIPATLPSLPHLIAPFCQRHPGVNVQVQSLSSIAIQRALDDFEIDAGVTYLDNEPLRRVRCHHLYHEHYVFITQAARAEKRRTISWADAAAAQLCLLSRDMQNRRIIDQVFESAGVTPRARIETNSFVCILSHVRSGEWSSIVPHTYVDRLGLAQDLRALPLVNPVCTHSIGLVVSDREPLSPLANALLRCARGLDLERALRFEARTAERID
ncbi:MAG TPA: LysR family transcriptional regulator [Methyloceanibacter sp.]|nr:LysR family transcriptional regulator [Methyloceanibacter sp.]